MILRNKIFLIGLLLFLAVDVNAQNLKVTLSTDTKKVNRNNVQEGLATIVFDSKVKDLIIDNNTDDQWTKPNENMFVYLIDTKRDIERNYEVSQRTFVLNSPSSAEYILETGEIHSKQFLYYTVVLPPQYPVTLSMEWLMSLHAQKGLRVSFGGRYGLFIGVTWGDFRPSGDNIDLITTDCDLTYAKSRGYIRTTFFGGFRMGLISISDFSLYTYIGAGYGEHGRQWENKTRLENSKYFYSDYMKGVNTNLGLSLYYRNAILSFGGDMIMAKNKFMIEWQLGLGIYLNTIKWSKRKI